MFYYIKKNLKKIGNDRFLKVLSTHQRVDMSKSYFYFILDKMREMGLMSDNGIAFKAVISYDMKGDKVELKEKLMYVTNDKELLVMDMERDDYSCRTCSVRSLCINYLKLVAKESGVQINKLNPREAWREVMASMRRNLIRNAPFFKIPSDQIFEKNREKEIEISCERTQ